MQLIILSSECQETTRKQLVKEEGLLEYSLLFETHLQGLMSRRWKLQLQEQSKTESPYNNYLLIQWKLCFTSRVIHQHEAIAAMCLGKSIFQKTQTLLEVLCFQSKRFSWDADESKRRIKNEHYTPRHISSSCYVKSYQSKLFNNILWFQ